MSDLKKYTDEDLLRELVRRNGIQDAPRSRTMHLHEVLLGIGKSSRQQKQDFFFSRHPASPFS